MFATTIRNFAATTMAVLLLAGTTAATANAGTGTDAKLVTRGVTLQECLGPYFANGGTPSVKNINDCVGQYKKRDIMDKRAPEEAAEEADDDAAGYIIDGGRENTIFT